MYNINNKEGYIYFLFEHKSYPVRTSLFNCWTTWSKYGKEKGSQKWLPL